MENALKVVETQNLASLLFFEWLKEAAILRI